LLFLFSIYSLACICFEAVVRDIVDRYAMKSGIAMELKEMIVKLISTQWKNLQDQLVEEKPKKKKK
jgi:hypothetical protein